MFYDTHLKIVLTLPLTVVFCRGKAFQRSLKWEWSLEAQTYQKNTTCLCSSKQVLFKGQFWVLRCQRNIYAGTNIPGFRFCYDTCHMLEHLSRPFENKKRDFIFGKKWKGTRREKIDRLVEKVELENSSTFVQFFQQNLTSIISLACYEITKDN